MKEIVGVPSKEEVLTQCQDLGLDREVGERLSQVKLLALNTILGVYADTSGKQTTNIPIQELLELVVYNIKNRFGRALFVNGEPVYNGYLDDKRMSAIWKNIKRNGQYKPDYRKTPYSFESVDFINDGYSH